MNRQDYEKLNNLAISFGYLMSMIELAEHMTGEFICGNVTDDEEKAGVLWTGYGQVMEGLC